MPKLILRAVIIAVVAVTPAHGALAQTGTSATESVRAEPTVVQGTRKKYLVPAIELPVYLTMQSIFARILYPDLMEDGKKAYFSTWETTREHFEKWNWKFDKDPFDVNQFRHPYMGATMYGLWRTAGHGFWSSLVYSNVGSFLWEMAGETGPPSTNDMITTGQAGSLLGEALFRIANVVLPDRPGEPSRLKHGILADLIFPPRGLNRRLLGDGFRTHLSSVAPAYSWSIGIGATGQSNISEPGDLDLELQRDASVEYSVTYGLPGKPGYTYSHPLAYFDFQISALFDRKNPLENIMLRGLLLGKKSSSADDARGIWGLYGSFDYFSPYLFRVSSTALSLGTTRQDWLGDNFAVQTSLLGGAGWGAAGTTAGIPTPSSDEAIRDYHYGITPQGLAAIKLIAADRVMLDGAARGYYVSGMGSDNERGKETILRGNAGLTVRLFGGHSLGARFVVSTRKAEYATIPDRKLSDQTITLSYLFLGRNRFGAVDWK
jgi:hypothetical protein